MTRPSDLLTTLSNGLADVAAAAAPSVVQVHGAKRPASGVFYARDVVVTTVDALGREDALIVRGGDSASIDAELVGWDPTTSLAALRVAGFTGTPIGPAAAAPRVGHLAIALARSWTNALTASAGIVAVIGGPLPRGRRRAIEQVIRTTAPMHGGFAGGPLVDTTGALVGVTTSMMIRGTHVVIPSAIVSSTVAMLLEHGRVKRGFLGIAGQAVRLAEPQKVRLKPDTTTVPEDATAPDTTTAEHALLVAGVTPGSPAAAASLLVGDIIVTVDNQVIASPEDLLDVMARTPAGRQVNVKVLRGTSVVDVTITVGERPGS